MLHFGVSPCFGLLACDVAGVLALGEEREKGLEAWGLGARGGGQKIRSEI